MNFNYDKPYWSKKDGHAIRTINITTFGYIDFKFIGSNAPIGKFKITFDDFEDGYTDINPDITWPEDNRKVCNKCKKPINHQQQRKILGKDYHSYCAPKPLEINSINPDVIPKILRPEKIQPERDDIVVCKNCTTVWSSKFNYCPMCAAGLYEIEHNIITCESCYSVYSTIHENCPKCGEQN